MSPRDVVLWTALHMQRIIGGATVHDLTHDYVMQSPGAFQ
jgi:hypothetical protein